MKGQSIARVRRQQALVAEKRIAEMQAIAEATRAIQFEHINGYRIEEQKSLRRVLREAFSKMR